MDLKQHRW